MCNADFPRFIMFLLGCTILIGCGKKQEKKYRVGILSEVEAFTVIADGFKTKMTEMGYIEGTNLIENQRLPGDDITGVRSPGADNDIMCLEFLHKFVPEAKRVLIIYDPNYPTTQIVAAALREAAPSLGITLIENHVISVEELKDSLNERSTMDDIGIDAIRR